MKPAMEIVSVRKHRIALELAADAIGNLHAMKARTFLALVGIAIGTAAVIAMLHIGQGARREAMRQFKEMGIDFVSITPSPHDGAMPEIALKDALGAAAPRTGLNATAPIIAGGALLIQGRKQLQVNVAAATPELLPVLKLRLRDGRFVSNLDGFMPYVVLGSHVAREIEAETGKPVATGDRVRFNSQVFTVIGTLENTAVNPILPIISDDAAVIPFGAARRLFTPHRITHIAARQASSGRDKQTVSAVYDYFRECLRGEFIQVTIAQQLIENVERQMRIYAVLLLAIGAVSLVVGGIGIMNVMLMSVFERQQEIGLRLAVGASPAQIQFMFLVESVVLSSIGSAIGVVLGAGAGWIFALSSGWQFAVEPFALPLGAGMALTVGLFFGSYPARRAARLEPAAALRGE